MSIRKPQAEMAERGFLYKNYAKWFGIVLTMIGMVAAAMGWAANRHLSLKDFAIEHGIEAKREAIEVSKDLFVPKEDFSKVQTRQEYLIEKVNKIDDKVDDIHDLLIKGRRQ